MLRKKKNRARVLAKAAMIAEGDIDEKSCRIVASIGVSQKTPKLTVL